jgi:hypothetical protein
MSASEIETKALGMGWMPKEKFRGDPEKWVPAETFVERGETFVPYLKANNRKLEAKVDSLSAKLTEQANAFQEQIEALRSYNSEFNKQRVESQRKEIVAGIKAAREEGDVEAEEVLRERLAETKKALSESDEKKPAAPKPSETTQIQPTAEVKQAFEAFREAHTWYEEDHMMKSAFIGTMQTKMLDPEFQKLSVPERFEEVAQAVESRFGLSPRGKAKSKYEGSSGGGGPESRTDRAKGYAELPAEAKEGCDRYAAKLVGKGKAYATVEAWQKKFAEDYWRNNPNG